MRDDRHGLSTSMVALSATMLLLGVTWFFLGLHRIQHREDYGWFICAIGTLTFVFQAYRLAKFEIAARRRK